MTDFFRPGGLLAQHFPGYENRPQQEQMALSVWKNLLTQGRLLVEAGTGVGKSFSYLIPAVLAALTGVRKPIVISTHTISLQEQLLNKDLPALMKLMPFPFHAKLVKGRNNYLSLRRLRVAQNKAPTLLGDPDYLDQLHRTGNWSLKTLDGSKSDLDWQPDPDVWNLVESDSSNCLGRSCKEFGRCFYFKARRGLDQAELLLVNHALFLSDLALRAGGGQGFLPDYQAVIIDEAHTFEEVAFDQFGGHISQGGMNYFFERLLHAGRRERGLLAGGKLPGARVQLQKTREVSDNFFSSLLKWFSTQVTGEKNQSLRIRLPITIEEELSKELNLLASLLLSGAEGLQPEEKIEFEAMADRANDFGARLVSWLKQEEDRSVFWLETTGNKKLNLHMRSAPVEIGPLLEAHLFSKETPVILTSATLSTGGSSGFVPLKEKLGVIQAEDLCLASPFNFAKQVDLYLYREMPDPAADPALFEETCLEQIKTHLNATKGKAFVLFTNIQVMHRAAKTIEGWCESNGLPLLVQAQGVPRTRMIEIFRESNNAVLLGVDSFWQGVDVQGDALSNVIITRLPFVVPGLPLNEARQEAIQARGGNPFMDWQIPTAVLKLKQGFGRLIRSATDRGRVVILDPRLVTKRYGSLFLRALPECRLFVDGEEMDWIWSRQG